MNIGFYGHSAASWYGNERSFIDQIKEQLNCKIVNIGVPQGSEERILFELKKTKNLDIAVIFHQYRPGYMFLPNCNRDVTMDAVPENKSKILWSERSPDGPDSQELFEKEFFHRGKIKEVFGTTETFIECMHYYKNYLYHSDLHRNRFESATLMIDTYCSARVPKVIHISKCQYEKEMPWFSFKSGVIAKDVSDLTGHHYSPGTNPNNISDEGNRLIAERLIEIIKQNNWHV